MTKVTCTACGMVFDTGSTTAGGAVNCPACGHANVMGATEVGNGGAAAPAICGLAIAALLLGIFGWVPLLGIVAMSLGTKAVGEIDRAAEHGRPLSGRGLAIAGRYLGACGTVAVGLAVLLALAHTFLTGVHRHDAQLTNANQVRAIPEALATWAETSTQIGDFPGAMAPRGPLPVNASYNSAHPTTGRFWTLLAPSHGEGLAAKRIISTVPGCTDDCYRGPAASAGAPMPRDFGARNISYALLDPGSIEWKNNVNEHAILAGDKNTSGNAAVPTSYWSGSRPWYGHLGWGDVHVTYETNMSNITVTIGQNMISVAQQGNTIFAARPQAGNSTGLYLINPN